jgi:choline-sulfatase
MQWLKNTAPGIAVPWVLVVNVTAPHFPHFAPPEFWDIYPGDGDLPDYGPECESAQHPYAKAIKKHFETHSFTEQQVRGLRKGYLACISFVDHQLGRLIGALENAGLSDTTNVVYTSDHGDMLGKFRMWWKCSLYEDSVRIPMITAGPDFAEGTRVTTPVDLHDLQASLFAATGTVQPSEFLGSPLQHIPMNEPDRVVFSEYHGHGAPGSSYMIRKGNWKYMHYTDAPCQLFDLSADPNELHSVAEARPAKARELATELQAVCSPSLENDRVEQFINRQLEYITHMAEQSSRGDS